MPGSLWSLQIQWWPDEVPTLLSLQPTRETDLKRKAMCAVMSGKAFWGGDFRARLEGFVM